MPTLTIPDVKDAALDRLRALAQTHGRTPEAEAKAILEEELLQSPSAVVWERVNAFRQELAGSNRTFGDSTDSLREDRER